VTGPSFGWVFFFSFADKNLEIGACALYHSLLGATIMDDLSNLALYAFAVCFFMAGWLTCAIMGMGDDE